MRASAHHVLANTSGAVAQILNPALDIAPHGPFNLLFRKLGWNLNNPLRAGAEPEDTYIGTLKNFHREITATGDIDTPLTLPGFSRPQTLLTWLAYTHDYSTCIFDAINAGADPNQIGHEGVSIALGILRKYKSTSRDLQNEAMKSLAPRIQIDAKLMEYLSDPWNNGAEWIMRSMTAPDDGMFRRFVAAGVPMSENHISQALLNRSYHSDQNGNGYIRDTILETLAK